MITVHVPLAVIIAPCLFPPILTTHPCAAGFAAIAAILWIMTIRHSSITIVNCLFFYYYYIVGPSASFRWVVYGFMMAGCAGVVAMVIAMAVIMTGGVIVAAC